MKLQDQVCTLEQAKELKALGVIQKSFFTWYGGFEGSEVEPAVDLTDQRLYDVSVNGWYGHPDNTYSAFTVAELGFMLSGKSCAGFWMWSEQDNCYVYPMEFDGVHYSTFHNEAEGRAELLINLIKAKMKSVVMINQNMTRIDPESVTS